MWIMGGGGFTLTINGVRFVKGSKVLWNNAEVVTRYISTAQVSAAIPGNYVMVPGQFTVKVQNPTPGGGKSFGKRYTIWKRP